MRFCRVQAEGERIQHWQQILDQLLAAVLQRVFLLALKALAQIVLIGALAQHRVFQLGDLRGERLDFRLARVNQRRFRFGGRLRGGRLVGRRDVVYHLVINHKNLSGMTKNSFSDMKAGRQKIKAAK